MYPISGIFRKKARDALKGHWQTALLIALIVNLPTLLIQGFAVVTGNDPADRLPAFITAASRDGVMSYEALTAEIRTLITSAGFWAIRGLDLLAWLATPCLALGMYKWVLDRLAGQEPQLNTVFSRVRIFFKAAGLQLLIVLKILAWMLPGIAAAVIALLPAFRAADQQSMALAVQSSYAMALPITLLIAIPGAMAALRYALAELIMAENPENKILFCVRRSKYLMEGQKKNLFMLLISFLLWYLLSMLISSMVPGVIALVVQMLASLALSVYMSASVGCFYRYLEKSGEQKEKDSEDTDHA